MAGTIVVDRIESDGSYGSTIDVASNVNFSGGMSIGGQPASFGNRNKIINGAMLVAQRNTSTSTTVTSSASNGGYHNVDRFRTGVGSSGTVTDVRSTDVPAGQGFLYSKQITVATANTSSSRYAEFMYGMEGTDLLSTGWVPTDPNSWITLSFWAKSSLTGRYVVQARNPRMATPRMISQYYTLEANTWKKITFSIPGDASGTWTNDRDTGINFWWNVDTGSNFTDNAVGSPEGQWFANPSEANYYQDYQQTWFGTVGNTFAITGVQLELGKNATGFEFKSYGQELVLCQRYYQRIQGDTTAQRMVGTGVIGSSTQIFRVSVPMKTSMRVAPTVSASGLTGYDGSTNPAISLSTGYQTTEQLSFDCSGGSGYTLGRAGIILTGGSNSSYFEANAEL